MKTLNQLESFMWDYLPKVHGENFSDEKDFEKDLMTKLQKDGFDVESQLSTQPLNDDEKVKLFTAEGAIVPDLVVKVEEGFIPIELKFDNTPALYKKDEEKICRYVEHFSDVPKAWCIFLDKHEHEDYNNGWQSIVNSSYRYMWRYKADSTSGNLKLADVWSERRKNAGQGPKKTSSPLKSLLLLFALMIGIGNAWGTEYSSTPLVSLDFSSNLPTVSGVTYHGASYSSGKISWSGNYSNGTRDVQITFTNTGSKVKIVLGHVTSGSSMTFKYRLDSGSNSDWTLNKSATSDVLELSASAGSHTIALGPAGTSTRTVVTSIAIYDEVSGSTWYVKGGWNSWGTTDNLKGSGTELSTTVNITTAGKYEFKIFDSTSSGTWWGNGGNIGCNVSGWTFESPGSNCTFFASETGNYTFTFNTSTKKLSVTYPTAQGKYYYKNTGSWSNVAVYRFKGGIDNGWPGSIVVETEEICGDTYYFTYADPGTTLIFNNNDGGSQTGDMAASGNAGKYVAGTGSSWSNFPTYTVTYNKNGDGAGGAGSVTGSVPTDGSSPYACGSTVTVLGNTGSLVRTGYNFTGWNTAANGSGAGYTAGNTFTISANTTLYAQWELIPTYDVIYNTNGGTGGSTATQEDNDDGSQVTTSANGFTKTGYKFKWWNTAANGSGEDFYPGEKVTIASADVNLYAQWEQVESGWAYWVGDDASSSPTDITGNGVTMRLARTADYNTDLTAASTTVNATGKHAKVFGIGADDKYVEISFTDGSPINSLTLGVATKDGSSPTIAVMYSTTSDFSSGEYYFAKPTVPTVAQTSKSTTSVNPDEANKYKYVRIYRKISTAVYEQTGGSGKTTRIYSIKAQKGVSCVAPTTVNVTATVNEVSGYWFYPDDDVVLTATPTGSPAGSPVTYQWKKNGSNVGTNSATLTINDAAASDAGKYTCTISYGACSTTSAEFELKCMQFYLKNSGGGDISNHALQKVDATHATLALSLTGGTTYKFRVTDGCNNWYGNSDATGMTSSNCSNWTMPHDADCKVTTSSKSATYTFNFDFSAGLLGSEMKVSVVYPSGDQPAGKIIYWDNSVLNWASAPWYRIGKGTHNTKTQMTLVPGTANLYKVTTAEYNGFEYWHIANNEGEGTGNIFWTKDSDPATNEAITVAMGFEGSPVTADAVTFTPTAGSHGTGTSSDNDNCEFYEYGQQNGMKTDRVTISDYSGGTITVSYTDVSNVAQSFTSGNRDLAHTVIITPTATPATGYDLGGLTVNAVAHTSGNTYTCSGATVVAATFTPHVYTITYKDQGNVAFSGTHADGYPTSHTYGTATTLKGATKTGYNFGGWFGNSSCTGDAMASVGATSYSTNITLYAKWTAKTTSVTLNPNTANHGTGSNVIATATFDGTSLTGFSAATPEGGYTLSGYYTAATSGTKILNADGSFVRNTSYTTDESTPKWKSEAASLELFAQYEAAAPVGPSYTAPTSALDISAQTSVTAAALITAHNATQTHYLSTNTDTLLLIPSDIYYNIGDGKENTWATVNGSPGSTNADWSCPAGSVSFKGRKWWQSSGNISTLQVRSDRSLNIRVKGCKTVSVLNAANSSTQYFVMEAYEYDDGYKSSDPDVSASNTSTSVTETSLSLNSSKEYVVVLRGNTQHNNKVYEIKFIASATPCTVEPTVSATTTGATTSTTQVVNCSGISSLGTGTCTITSYGFVYGTSANPTLSDSHVEVGTSYTVTGTAFAETTLTGLTPSTTYYVRAYATNGAGTGYGDAVSFTTSAAPVGAPVITVQPTLSEVALGETASFSLTATGATSYQWYSCDSEGENRVEASGASAITDNYSYTTTATGTTYYICKVSNASGDTWSDVIPCVVSPTNFTIHYETNTSTSSTNYDIAHFTQTKEVNSEVTSYITSLTNFAKTSGIAISDAAKKQDKIVTMSGKISILAAYDENEYLSYTFTVANNYYLSIDSIDIRCQPVGGDNRNFKVVLTDALGTTITGNISTTTSGVLNRIPFTSAELNGKKLVGTVTVKIYGWYTSADTYRLGRHSYIYGTVSSLPAPTASWTARPASATVGDGGKTYTLTTDGTNTVAWSITDQSGATDAALSPTSGLTTTLGSYTTAGSLYVQAAVTGDGIHYLSTPATLLRQRVVISADCEETTLISATLSSCTGTGDVSGTPGGTSAVAFESCESLDGGYKMGKDGSYMRLELSSGNFAANDEVKITITKASDLGDGALHIYKYASSTWTELGSVVAAGAGTYTYRLTESNVSTPFNTIGLYRTGKNQNPYVKALSVVRNSCSESKPSSVTVTASPAGPYAIGATPTLTVTATNADTYQWYSNTNNTASDGFLLVGETATTYSPSTAIAGTTYYYCVATNASGSTVSNIITVTVNSAKTAPTVSWTDTYETPNYGGGGYAVKATVSTAEWDGTLTTDMLTASDGVTLTGVSVSGKVITATYGVTETARSPLSFSLTLPETTNYTALAANKEITFDRCGEGAVIATTETQLPVKSSYTTASNPTYRWETDGVGWLTLVTGSSTLSSTSDSYSGFSYRSNSGKSSITFYSELDAVSAVRIYIKGGGSTTLSKVQKGTTLGKYTQLAPSTDYDYSYSNGSSSIESREQGYIEITFKTALSANTFVEITLNRNTEYYGVGLITGNSEVGNITTALSWATDPGTTVNKTTTDANFRYEAVKASDAASQATLGTISYKSSVPAVATVSATGVVDVLSEGTTTITATLASSGCYKKATLSYNLVVAAATCTDLAGTIAASGTDITIDGNTVTKADACAAVTLTVSGHTGEDAGATYQWYKDGVSMGESYRSKSISVTDNGDYTVEVTNTGGVHCTMPATNTITITGNAISITKIVDEWYVKNGRRTPNIALATIEGTTSWKVNDGSADIWVVSDGVASTTTGFGGCQFELRDGIVYLKGTQDDGSAPSGLAAGDVTLTITAVRDCSGASPNVSITIHKQAATVTPSIAFIVDGTKGDPVNNVATAKTSSRPIWVYLSTYFDLTGCNAYWTNNEKLIRQYYSQFDAIVITDDPSTDTKPSSGLKYVNALGTMVDVRPILTMEAYVGKYGASSNWHIGGTPSSPNPRQYELKLQCKDHDIFSDLTPSANFRSEEIDGETYYYVTMVDNSVTPYAGLADDAETETYPALQGFSAASIKGTGLLGIGTISDGTLQGGVERQDEPTARMMILGIQHQAMAALTSEGKQVIKNAINYLLKTDMEEVDDCSNYFIGGTVGHEQEWHTASNWSSTKVPDASTKARIMAPVTISTTVHVAQVDIAVDGRSIHYDSGNTNCSGSVTIASTGALIVDGQVRRTTNGRLFTEDELQPTTPADLTILSSSEAQGALIFDNSEGETQATVTVRSKANKEGSTRNWQYLTSPLQETPVTEFFYGVGTYTYKHSEADGGWVRYNLGTTFNAFDAIGLTQEDAKDFVFYGPLAPTGEWNLSLTHAHSGDNLFGNSWTAPIDLKALVRNTDFDSNIELDLAIYNTGADRKNGSGEFDQAANADITPGTWHHIPLLLATLEDAGWEGMTVIPAYQAFQLKVKDGASSATLTIDYDKCVRGTESANYNEPLRAPRRRSAGRADSDIEALRLAVSDAKGIAYIYLLEGEQFSEEYDNGWELEYKPNSKYGKLYAISPEQGDMMALARPSLEGTMVGFQPGESSEYTITFNETDGYYYLNDLKMEQSTLIQAGESYTFSVEEGESANRFLISSVPFNKPGIVTGVTNPNAEAPKAQKVIYNDKLYIIRGGKVFSADGQLVK